MSGRPLGAEEILGLGTYLEKGEGATVLRAPRGKGGKLYQAEEVETPHRAVTPSIADVAESGRLLDPRDSFGWIVTQETL
jgi:hypothetical protein